jgi:hypothetical protein
MMFLICPANCQIRTDLQFRPDVVLCADVAVDVEPTGATCGAGPIIIVDQPPCQRPRLSIGTDDFS